jgi:hypothetical protein
MSIGEGFEMRWRSLPSRNRVVPTFFKRDIHLPMDAVRMSRLDQKILQNDRQNLIQLSKNDHHEMMKRFNRTKLLD